MDASALSKEKRKCLQNRPKPTNHSSQSRLTRVSTCGTGLHQAIRKAMKKPNIARSCHRRDTFNAATLSRIPHLEMEGWKGITIAMYLVSSAAERSTANVSTLARGNLTERQGVAARTAETISSDTNPRSNRQAKSCLATRKSEALRALSKRRRT